jgi:hypothetical protein
MKVLKNLIISYEKYFSKIDKKIQKTGEFLVVNPEVSPKFSNVYKKFLLNSSDVLKCKVASNIAPPRLSSSK